MFEITGRIALVTGAANGIGRETALTLARAGARVYAADRDPAPLEDAPGDIVPVKLDVTSEDDWARAAAQVAGDAGKLDILVNNAGIMESRSFAQTSIDDFRRTQRVNAESVFIGVKATHDLLVAGAKASEGKASIVNISSIYGQVGGHLNTAYCASKGAVKLLTKALALELGPLGIRVNSVHPGGVDTALGRGGLQASVDAGFLPSVEAGHAMVEQMTALGRFARTDDIAGVVLFLASDASKFMTGSEVTVDGGFTAI